MLKKQSETSSEYVLWLMFTNMTGTCKQTNKQTEFRVCSTYSNTTQTENFVHQCVFPFSEGRLQRHLLVTLVGLRWLHLQQIMRETIACVVDRARLRVRLKPRPDTHHRCTTTYCREFTVETCVYATHYNPEDTNSDRHSYYPLVLRCKTKQWKLSNCAL